MQNKNVIQYQLDKIRNQIIDYGLVIGSILATITYLISLIQFFDIGFRPSFITDFIVVLGIVIITFYRKKIPVTIKSIVILLSLFMVLFVDLLQYGLLSANKVVLVLIPFFALLVFNLRYAILVFFFSILGFITIGYLIITNQNPMLLGGPMNLEEVNSWIINILLLLIVAILIFIASHRYGRIYTGLLLDLEKRNKAIAESERNYREIFNASTDAIFIHDMKGSILDVNKSMLKMYGYDSEDVSSLAFQDLVEGKAPYDMKNAHSYIRKAIREGEQIFDWKARKKDGTIFWVEVALKKTKIGGDDRVLAVVRDIDEKKRIALQLEKYRDHLEVLVKERTDELATTNKELQHINKELIGQKEELSNAIEKLRNTQEQLIQKEKMASLGVLTTGIGHEINNPLNFIQTGIYSLENYFEDNADCKDFCNNREQIARIKDHMQVGVERVSNIVKGLNHFSRQSDSFNESCNLHAIIDNCLLILHNQIKDKIHVEKRYHDAEIILEGNEGKLHQIFMNLLANSIHAIDVRGEITIETGIANNEIMINIKDNGKGISEDNLSRIFDPFFTTKEAGKGTGLGLSIVYGIVREHQGKINIKSKIEAGTEVNILLPLAH